MSRLYEAFQERRITAPPYVYRGEFSGDVYLQWPWPDLEPVCIGKDMRAVEELRDKLTLFLEGSWEEAK